MKTKIVMLAAVAGLAFASAANADGILSFRYVDLDGSYVPTNATTGSFTAAASGPVLNTSGDVTRLIPTLGTATFAPGFVTGLDAANASFSISVENLDAMLGIADGAGTFTLTDLNGDTFTGNILGTWVRGINGNTFFNGDLDSVVFNNVSGDGLFDGNTGSIVGDLGFPGVFEGALVQVFIRTAGFFNEAYSGVPTNTEGVIVPAPAAAGLMGLAGLAAARRRRR